VSAGYAARGRALVWSARLAVGAAFVFLISVWAAKPTPGGDTPWLLDGTDFLSGCLSRGTLVKCGYSAVPDDWSLMTLIGPWPPLQYIPDLIATSLGVSTHPDRVRILASLGIASLVLGLFLVWLVFRRFGQPALFWVFVFVFLSGPLLAYGNTSWGEVLAAGVLVCFVAATLLQAPPAAIAGAAFAACLTKETSYPVVVALGLLGLVLAKRRTARPITEHAIWGACGVAAAFVLTSLFNIIRFGSILNKNYLHSDFHTPGVVRKLDAVAGLLASPSGGILVFWTSASILVIAACLPPLLRATRRRRVDADVWPALIITVVALGLIVTLASWWTPFGWLAWGPRLSLPWVLPLVLLSLVAYGEPIAALLGRLLGPTTQLLLVAVAFSILTLPHIGYLWRPEATAARFFSQTDRACNPGDSIGTPRHYRCLHEQMWIRRPLFFDSGSGLQTDGGLASTIVVTLGLAGALVLLRAGLQPAREQRAVSNEPAHHEPVAAAT
jgi:hypothetical protein